MHKYAHKSEKWGCFSLVPWSLYLASDISIQFVAAISPAFKEGSEKYGVFNYRNPDDKPTVSRLFDAFIRHWVSHKMGQIIDPDSGIPHLFKAASNLFILYDCILAENIIDDRVRNKVEWEEPLDRQSMQRVLSWKDFCGEEDPFPGCIERVEKEAEKAGLIPKTPEQLQAEAERYSTWIK